MLPGEDTWGHQLSGFWCFQTWLVWVEIPSCGVTSMLLFHDSVVSGFHRYFSFMAVWFQGSMLIDSLHDARQQGQVVVLRGVFYYVRYVR